MEERICEALVLHAGWEMDNKAWVISEDNVLKVMTTNHGWECVMSKEELDDKIKETENSLRDLKHIRELVYLKGHSPKE